MKILSKLVKNETARWVGASFGIRDSHSYIGSVVPDAWLHIIGNSVRSSKN
jgi:hypothetical protein